MVRKILTIVFSIIMAMTSLVNADTFQLENGITVITIQSSERSMASAVLVCALPRDLDSRHLAELSLVNHYIWQDDAADDNQEMETRLLVRRFGGSFSSQVLHDAFVMRMTVPAEILPDALTLTAATWDKISVDEQTLAQVKDEIYSRGMLARMSSVSNQLEYELYKRLWSDLSYSSPITGSQEDMAAIEKEDVESMFSMLRNPARWVLVVSAPEFPQEFRASLENSLGTIKGSDTVDSLEVSPRPQPKLGITLQLPASIDSKNALVVYRLSAASELDEAALHVLAETIRRSPQMKALKEDLSVGDADPELTVTPELRREGGSLALYARWENETSREDVVNRLQFLAANTTGSGPSAEAFAEAKKAVRIRYWQRTENAAAFSDWIALRKIVGAGDDTFDSAVSQLTVEELAKFVKHYFIDANSMSLITVKQ